MFKNVLTSMLEFLWKLVPSSSIELQNSSLDALSYFDPTLLDVKNLPVAVGDTADRGQNQFAELLKYATSANIDSRFC